MLLQKIARNHPEDTVSDIIWYICRQDQNFARKLISPFISSTHLNEFTIVDIVRNYIISDGYMPDLTFLLSHKKTNKIVYMIIETKISATEAVHHRKKRTKTQYSIYKNYLNKKNKGIPKKYNITDKCILLCPSYYNIKGEENNVVELRFPSLLETLKDSTIAIKNELIKYLEEEFEGPYIDLNENLEILKHKIEFKSAQKHILALRHTMLNEENISKSGLWQKTSDCYCYFSIGLRTSYTPLKEVKSWKHRSWLSYEFYLEEEIYSPLKLSFPNKLIKKNIIHVAKYLNKNKFYGDLLTESKINPDFIKIFDWLQCSKELKEQIIQFTNYYKQPTKQSYLVLFNKFLGSLLNYFGRFTNEISTTYYTAFEHSLNNSKIVLRLTIKKRSDGRHHISIIAEPTSFDLKDLLRMEVFEDSEQISTEELIVPRKKGFRVKYNIDSLKDKIDSTFQEMYES